MEITIRKLTDADPQLVETASMWMYEWWGKAEGYCPAAIKSYMQHSLQQDRLPQTYGIFCGKEFIGLYQFRLEDLFVRPDLYPWLANVYIHTPYRGRGCGKAVLQRMASTARENLPFKELYLYTAHQGLYEKYGWEFICEIDTYLPDARIQRLYRLSLV